MMRFAVVTLFPQMVADGLHYGVCGRALEQGLATLLTVNPRDHAEDPHRNVDDRPYGGGPGMVLKEAPLRKAIHAARRTLPAGARTVFLGPQGQRLGQELVREMAGWEGMVLVCGRYEGFDERLVEAEADCEISLGDFVLSGGELAAMAVIDAVTRLLPGALGDDASAEEDSFSSELLDHPHYTRPEVLEDGRSVPAVLLGGNHEAIRRWRLKQALGRTKLRRPELLEKRLLTAEEQQLLGEYLAESVEAKQEL